MKSEKKKTHINRRLNFCEWDYLLKDAPQKRQKMRAALSNTYFELKQDLSGRQEAVIEMLYGKGLGLAEASKKLGISHQAVHQAKDRGLIKIGQMFIENMSVNKKSEEV